MTTLKTLADQMYQAFEIKHRDSGETFVALKDDAPDWMTDAIHDAHGDMMPDDWRYQACMEAAEAIADADDIDSARDSFMDAVDVYNSDLMRWLDSHGSRTDYVDQAVEDYGWPDGGLMQAIAIAQSIERGEVWDAIVAHLETLADEDE